MAAAWVAAREAGMVVVARVVRAAAVETVVTRAVAVRVAGRLEARAAAGRHGVGGSGVRAWRRLGQVRKESGKGGDWVMLQRVLRNAKKSMEGSEGGRTLAPPAPEAAFSPEGTAGVPPVAARRGPGVSAQWPARCLGQKSRSRPLGSAPERVRLGGEARGGERRESD